MQSFWKMETSVNMLHWVYLFINQRYYVTRVDDVLSSYKQCKIFVPQRAVTSPTLFYIMVNNKSYVIKIPEQL